MRKGLDFNWEEELSDLGTTTGDLSSDGMSVGMFIVVVVVVVYFISIKLITYLSTKTAIL